MKKAKQHIRELRGAIVRYTSNKHNDIDGLVIDERGDMMDIKFPPHTARFIREVAGAGDIVQFLLEEKPHPPRHQHEHPKPRLQLVSIKNESTQQQFSVASVEPPHPPEAGRLVPFTIAKPKFTRGGKHDEITGVIFEDKYIHLHPGEYEEGEKALATAAVLQVKAKKRIEDAGFINAGGYIVYHAHSIHIGKN